MTLVDKHGWIASLVRGRSFADIGGLWVTTNEVVSVASAHGAAHLARIDIQPPGTEAWSAFDARMAEMGVADYHCITADPGADGFQDRVGGYDVVHCSGLVYHLADPLSALFRLRQVVRDHLVLTSMHVPEVIENEAGRLDLSGGRACLLHALEGQARAVMHRHFERLELRIAGLTAPSQEPLVSSEGRGAASFWWWLMTPSLLGRMLEIAGFEVLDAGETWEERSYSFLCRAAG